MNFYSQVCRPTGMQGIIMARRMNRNHQGMMQWALERMDVSSVIDVLDIGCGGGGPLSMLSERTPVARFVALDLSKAMLRMTCKVNPDLFSGRRLRTVQGSVASLPLQDASFDMVLACETSYFWPDLAENLKECRRVLQGDGRLFLVQETWDAPQWKERNESWQKGFQMKFHSLEGYRSLLKQAGFTRVLTQTEEDEGWFVMEARCE